MFRRSRSEGNQEEDGREPEDESRGRKTGTEREGTDGHKARGRVEGPQGRGWREYLEVAAQLVDHEGGESLLLDVLSHDHDGVSTTNGLLQDVDHVAGGGDLFVNKQQAAALVLADLYIFETAQSDINLRLQRGGR